MRLRNSAGEDIDSDTEVYVESDDIIRLLRKQKIQLNRGTVERLRNENKQFINVEGKQVFYYDFDTKKRCSAAIQRDFDEIRAPTDNMPIDFNNLPIRRNLGWSFYSLKDDLHHNLDEYLIDSRARADLEYPNPESESFRMDCLYKVTNKYIQENGYPASATIINALQEKSYCEFSGGGDLLIKADNNSCVVVQEEIHNPGSSPTEPKTAIQHMAIEGEKGEDIEKLKYQLYANLIAATTSRFLKNIQHYTLQDIFSENFALVSYGIPYTGSGIVGFYKLKMTFIGPIVITARLEIKMRPKDIAAALVDHLYEIYFKKLQ